MKALLESDQPAYPAVSVLKRMNVFEVRMEGDDILYCYRVLFIIIVKQRGDSRRNF